MALLTEDSQCLVVGGGKTALRKARLLLDADALVTVVAPRVEEELAELAGAGRLRLERRRFTPADADGMRVVFAATDDCTLNREILEHCRNRPTLACAVDRNWREGDFITPATLRMDGTLVSVSTGGKSCRFSRLIKDNLTRHLDAIRSADLFVLGTSHRHLSVEQREPYHLVGERLDAAGEMLMQVSGVHEFVLLNTCNRVELLAVAAEETIASRILEKLLGLDRLAPGQFYRERGYAAFEHSAFVIAGLLSQSPGEKHIVAQAKEAWKLAAERNWSGSILEEWLGSALHVAKHIRQLYGRKSGHAEIEDLCMAYLAAGRPLGERRVLVLGAGEVGRGLIAGLSPAPIRCLWCYRTRKPRIPAHLADRVELVPLDGLAAALATVDTVICAAGGTDYILARDLARRLREGTDIIDLAMPRNADPALADPDRRIRVVDLDGLKQWSQQEPPATARLRQLAEGVAHEHRASYEKLIGSLQNRNQSQ